MKTSSIALRTAIVLTAMLGQGCSWAAGRAIEVDLEVRLELEDREFSPHGYSASYRHHATLGLVAGTHRNSPVTETAWSGFETCPEPPFRTEWTSPMDFASLSYDSPSIGFTVRDGAIWILYDTGREFGVEHPGAPPCGGVGGIAAGEWVTKRFFTGELSEGAEPIGDWPVYLYDEEIAVGGFVVAVIELDEAVSGKRFPISVRYAISSDIFDTAISVEGVAVVGE